MVAWAEAEGRRWAFSLSNAAAAYAEFRTRLDQLGEVDWDAVESRDFRDKGVKEAKQAEFLVHGSFPWHLVTRIVARTAAVRGRVVRALSGTTHRPPVDVRPAWHY